MYMLFIMYIYICIYVCVYVYIHLYTVNRIHEKDFRSDSSTQINFPLTNYLPRITFSCCLFVLGNFVRFFL